MFPKFLNMFKPGTISHFEREIEIQLDELTVLLRQKEFTDLKLEGG